VSPYTALKLITKACALFACFYSPAIEIPKMNTGTDQPQNSPLLQEQEDTAALANPQIRKLKAMAQRMEATIHVGKLGFSTAFLKSVDEELSRHELVKVKFSEFKDQKKQMAPELAKLTHSHLVMRVGNVAVYFRQNPEEEKRKIHF
jgi:RNA-binding protein